MNAKLSPDKLPKSALSQEQMSQSCSPAAQNASLLTAAGPLSCGEHSKELFVFMVAGGSNGCVVPKEQASSTGSMREQRKVLGITSFKIAWSKYSHSQQCQENLQKQTPPIPVGIITSNSFLIK
jgi:hypothetical protein